MLSNDETTNAIMHTRARARMRQELDRDDNAEAIAHKRFLIQTNVIQ